MEKSNLEVDSRFYRKVFALVIPMAIQNLINVGVMATDVIMLGKVGEVTLSGCSLGGQVAFVMNLFLFGITSGASVLTAQYWGKRDTESIERILGIALRFSMIASVLFMAVTLLIPVQVMHLFTNDEAIIAEGVKYLRIVALTYPISAFSASYLNIIKSVEKVVISTIVYASSLIANILINWVLIFGKLGFPAMGIEGAAIGTLVARILELLITLYYAKYRNREIKVHMSYFLKTDIVLMKDFLKYSGPVICNELLWGLGYSVSAAIIGHLGSSAVAANSVAQVVRQLSMVIVFGIGNATSIMLGQVLGEGKKELAEVYSKRFIKLALVGGIIGGITVLIASPVIIWGLGFKDVTAVYMKDFLIVMSYYVIGQALNTTWVVGIFRAGGDTKFGLFLDSGIMWGISIFGGFMAAFVFKLSVPVVYVILLSDEIIKIPICMVRCRQKKWLNNLTR